MVGKGKDFTIKALDLIDVSILLSFRFPDCFYNQELNLKTSELKLLKYLWDKLVQMRHKFFREDQGDYYLNYEDGSPCLFMLKGTLAKEVGLSHVTLRKTINSLEDKGIIRRDFPFSFEAHHEGCSLGLSAEFVELLEVKKSLEVAQSSDFRMAFVEEVSRVFFSKAVLENIQDLHEFFDDVLMSKKKIKLSNYSLGRTTDTLQVVLSHHDGSNGPLQAEQPLQKGNIGIRLPKRKKTKKAPTIQDAPWKEFSKSSEQPTVEQLVVEEDKPAKPEPIIQKAKPKSNPKTKESKIVGGLKIDKYLQEDLDELKFEYGYQPIVENNILIIDPYEDNVLKYLMKVVDTTKLIEELSNPPEGLSMESRRQWASDKKENEKKLERYKKSLKVAKQTRDQLSKHHIPTEEEREILKMIDYFNYKISQKKNISGYNLVGKNFRDSKNWTPLVKIYQMCEENGWDNRVFIDSQFERMKFWSEKRASLGYPPPNQCYSDKAKEAYELYVKETVTNNTLEGDQMTDEEIAKVKISPKVKEMKSQKEKFIEEIDESTRNWIIYLERNRNLDKRRGKLIIRSDEMLRYAFEIINCDAMSASAIVGFPHLVDYLSNNGYIGVPDEKENEIKQYLKSDSIRRFCEEEVAKRVKKYNIPIIKDHLNDKWYQQKLDWELANKKAHYLMRHPEPEAVPYETIHPDYDVNDAVNAMVATVI